MFPPQSWISKPPIAWVEEIPSLLQKEPAAQRSSITEPESKRSLEDPRGTPVYTGDNEDEICNYNDEGYYTNPMLFRDR